VLKRDFKRLWEACGHDRTALRIQLGVSRQRVHQMLQEYGLWKRERWPWAEMNADKIMQMRTVELLTAQEIAAKLGQRGPRGPRTVLALLRREGAPDVRALVRARKNAGLALRRFKNCAGCRTWKKITAFHANRSYIDKHSYYCRLCEHARYIKNKMRRMADGRPKQV
jgi:hypothetical protein